MIQVQDLSFSYGQRDVLRDISFELPTGSMTALIGINGSGKTTLLKILTGLLKAKEGKILIEGDDASRMTTTERGRTFGYMPQKNQGVATTVFEAVLLGRKPYFNWQVSHKDLKKVEEMLGLLELTSHAGRPCTELSGGELQKVVMARALVQEPLMLLLDEPVNHLDIKNQFEIMTLLQKVTSSMSLVTLVVLHDLSAALRFCNYFIFLKKGRMHSFGDRKTVSPEVIKDVFDIDVDLGELHGIPMVVPFKGTP